MRFSAAITAQNRAAKQRLRFTWASKLARGGYARPRDHDAAIGVNASAMAGGSKPAFSIGVRAAAVAAATETAVVPISVTIIARITVADVIARVAVADVIARVAVAAKIPPGSGCRYAKGDPSRNRPIPSPTTTALLMPE